MKKLGSLLFLSCAFLIANAETLNIPLQKRDDEKPGLPDPGKRSLVESPTCIVDTDGELSISAMGEINSVSISDESGFVVFSTLGDEGVCTYSIPTLSQGNYIIEVEIDEVIYEGGFEL